MVCAGVCGCGCVQMCVGGCFCEQVCMGVLWYTQVCRGGPGCVWKCSGVWVCMGMGGRVWDEFSEYLLAVYEPITDMYRYRPIYRLSADNRFCRYGISLSVSVIGIGRYDASYRFLTNLLNCNHMTQI